MRNAVNVESNRNAIRLEKAPDSRLDDSGEAQLMENTLDRIVKLQ